MKVTAALVAALAAAGFVSAEVVYGRRDVLYTERHQKRNLGSANAKRSYYPPPREGGCDEDTISFFHVNDVHAHLDQFAASGADCDDPSSDCFGGYARIKWEIEQLRQQHPTHLWLNAGDEFQGTLFFSYYGWAKIAETINQLGFDAMTLGNHEWDNGDEQLGEFLQNLTFPVTSCNVRSGVPSLNETIKDYVLFPEHGVAVIGATTPDTQHTSHVGNTTFILEPVQRIQDTIYHIRNTTDIRRIVALTHLGYDKDQELAAQTEGISLIIGGHSHTLIGSMPGAAGPYPTIVKDLLGNEVFVVTSYRWGEYVAHIEVTFDADGHTLRYEGTPIHLDQSVPMDQDLQDQILTWRQPFDAFAKEVVGETDNFLDQEVCKQADCLLGEVMADAMMYYKTQLDKDNGETTLPDFAFLNGGGVRAAIDVGNVTRGEAITAFPFGNAVAQLAFSGADLRKILEGVVALVNQFSGLPVLSTMQVSHELALNYDPSKPAGSMLLNVTIGGEPLDDARTYNVVTVDFVASGGDNIVPAASDFTTLDALDDVLVAYIQEFTPLTNTLEQRMHRVS